MNVPPGLPAAQNSDATSPFDAIRQINEHGEGWDGRELMPLLDYDKWENFAEVIEKARVAIAAAGGDPDAHASRRQEASGRTRRANYRLTRYGAYIVGMVGDVKKPAVAAALTYFAVRTHEAETAQTPRELTDREKLAALAQGVLDAQRRESEAINRAEVSDAALEAATPAIEHFERFVSADDVMLVKDWAALFGLSDPKAREILVGKRIIYRKFITRRFSKRAGQLVDEHEWRAYADRATFAWFDLRPQENVDRYHNGQVRQTLYVRRAKSSAVRRDLPPTREGPTDRGGELTCAQSRMRSLGRCTAARNAQPGRRGRAASASARSGRGSGTSSWLD